MTTTLPLFSFVPFFASLSLSLSMSSFDATPPVPASLAPAVPPGEALAEALGIKQHAPHPPPQEARAASSPPPPSPQQRPQQRASPPRPPPEPSSAPSPAALFSLAGATAREASEAAEELEEQARSAKNAAREAAELAASASAANEGHSQLSAARELSQAASELCAVRRDDFERARAETQAARGLLEAARDRASGLVGEASARARRLEEVVSAVADRAVSFFLKPFQWKNEESKEGERERESERERVSERERQRERENDKRERFARA